VYITAVAYNNGRNIDTASMPHIVLVEENGCFNDQPSEKKKELSIRPGQLD
jgi:hypothetical protein